MPIEYAGFLCLEKSWFFSPTVDGRAYLPGPGPLIKKNYCKKYQNNLKKNLNTKIFAKQLCKH